MGNNGPHRKSQLHLNCFQLGKAKNKYICRKTFQEEMHKYMYAIEYQSHENMEKSKMQKQNPPLWLPPENIQTWKTNEDKKLLHFPEKNQSERFHPYISDANVFWFFLANENISQSVCQKHVYHEVHICKNHVILKQSWIKNMILKLYMTCHESLSSTVTDHEHVQMGL